MKDLCNAQAGNEEDNGLSSSQIEASSQGQIDKDSPSESQVIGTDASALPGTLSSKYLRKQRRAGRGVFYQPPQSSRSGRTIKMTSKMAQVFAILQEYNAIEGNPKSTDELMNLAFAAAAELAGSVGVPEAAVEPVSYNDAVNDPKWRESMADEWKSLAKLKTFQFVNKLPPGKKAIWCK